MDKEEDDDDDLINKFNHTSHQLTVNDSGVRNENTDGDVGRAIHTGEGVVNSDLNDAVII